MNLLKPTIAVLLCIQVYFAQSQKAPIKFGKIEMADLEMSHYEKDSSASAVILCNYGRSWIDYGTDQFQVHHERVTRIKILNKDGYKYADHEFGLYKQNGAKEVYSGLKGYTYNLVNGKEEKIKLDKSAIFEEEVDENHERIRFTMPAVTEGSVIEFTYEITSDFLFNYQGWQFQYDIPVVWSEYRSRFIEYYKYKKDFQGYYAPTINETSGGTQSFTVKYEASVTPGMRGGRTPTSTETYEANYSEERLVLEHIPAFVEEPNLTTALDYISMVNYELEFVDFPGRPIERYRGTWESVNQKMIEHSYFGNRIRGNIFLNKEVEGLAISESSEEEKAQKIYHFVTNYMIWTGSNRMYAPDPLKQAFDKGQGSSAEINMILISMLNKAGINAEPVILSTRNHGMVREYKAVTSQFNYVICKAQIADGYVLLDATEKFLPFGVLPERCLNGSGFAISDSQPGWVSLDPKEKRKRKYSGNIVISNSGEMSGNLTAQYEGYSGLYQRKSYFKNGDEDYKNEITDYASWEVDSVVVGNSENLSESFDQSIYFSSAKESEVMGDIIYLNPLLVNRKEKNPYKLEERTYPVSYPSLISEDYYVTFQVPDGYMIDEMPEATNLMMPNRDAQFVYRIIPQGGNKFIVLCQFKINKTMFVQTEYAYLKEFYAQVVDKMNEQIVLKKSKT